MSENKKQSSIIKDAIALCIIALVASVALGFVNELTKGPIEALAKQKKAEAYQAIYAEAALVDSEIDELLSKVEVSTDLLASNGYTSTVIDEACVAYDANNNPIGYVMTVTSKEGFGGAIQFTMGYTASGAVTAIEFLSIEETAGLGMKATEPEFKNQFNEKNVEAFTVVKGGASADNEIDAISGATITSNAVTNSVNAAVVFANDLLTNGIGGVSHE